MILGGIEICCPVCKGDLLTSGSPAELLRCGACERRFPVIFGIPDLRVAADRYIGLEADRAKGLELAARFDELSFAELVDFYYSVTTVVPPSHARQYTRGMMTAVSRAAAAFACWERAVAPSARRPTGALLEIGCGTGPGLVAAAPHHERLVGVDVAFRWLVVAKKRLVEARLDIPVICAGAEALPFRDSMFDRVVADSVLEHVRNRTQALRECHRVMRPAGHLFVSTPNRYSVGPDPHTGLWAGSLLPERVVAAYMRHRGAIPPLRELLSASTLPALLREGGFQPSELLLPDIPPAQRRAFGRGLRTLVTVYDAARRLPGSERVLRWTAPVLQAVAQKSGQPASGRRAAGARGLPSLLRLSAGDLVAKTVNFITFVYLARILGVAEYGVVELSRALLAYVLLIADAGVELWATREVARGADARQLASRILPLRLLMSSVAFATLLAILPVLPAYPHLGPLVVLFGLSVFPQGASLKWAFMGNQRMTTVSAGLVLAQVVSAAAVFSVVTTPSGLLWVPVLFLGGEMAMAAYFWRRFVVQHGAPVLRLTLPSTRDVLRPAATIGAAHGLAVINFSSAFVLLGYLQGPVAVGWYGAAYKPVLALLAVPITYFLGLFPALSRLHVEDREGFRLLIGRSMRWAAAVAVPAGVAGTLLAEPVILSLFGPSYARSVPALQVLAWTAAVVVLRGTLRQTLNAAGRSSLDLRCAAAATGTNVVLAAALIPYAGIVGAALAAVAGELLWLAMAASSVSRYVTAVEILPSLWRPALAGLGMSASLLALDAIAWPLRAAIAIVIYVVAFVAMGRVAQRSSGAGSARADSVRALRRDAA